MTADEELAIDRVARVCHEAIRAFCASLGDRSLACWDDAPEWQRQSTLDNVRFHLANPEASDGATHENWLRDRQSRGWRYGPVKDEAKKEHPCMVPFEQLPAPEQAKDRLFRAVVHALQP